MYSDTLNKVVQTKASVDKSLAFLELQLTSANLAADHRNGVKPSIYIGTIIKPTKSKQ